MLETKRGLPNTCSRCGENPGEAWYAANEDQARAGQGLCRPCAFPEPEPDAGQQGPAGDGQTHGVTDDSGAPGQAETVMGPEAVGEPTEEPAVTVAPDDLTRIKGIGAARTAELAQLGISGFVELATAEFDSLVTAMEANPAVIRMWQSQAAKLHLEAEANAEA